MGTLSAGNSKFEPIPAGQAMFFSTGATGFAALDTPVAINNLWTLGSTMVVGPFDTDMTIFIYVTGGQLTYYLGTNTGAPGTSGNATLAQITELLLGYAPRTHTHNGDTDLEGWPTLSVLQDLGSGKTGALPQSKVEALSSTFVQQEALLGTQSPSVTTAVTGTSNPAIGAAITITQAAYSVSGVTNRRWRVFDAKVPTTIYHDGLTSPSCVALAAMAGRRYKIREYADSDDGPVYSTSTIFTAQTSSAQPWGGSIADITIDSVVMGLALDAASSKLRYARRVITATGGSPTTPTLVGTARKGFHASGSGTTITAQTPADLPGGTADKWVLFFLNVDAIQAMTFTWPSGTQVLENQVYTTQDGIRMIGAALYVAGTVAASYPITMSLAKDVGYIVAVASCDSVDDSNIAADTAQRASGFAVTTPNITTSQINDLLLCAIAGDPNGANLVTNIVQPTGFSEVTEGSSADSFGFCPISLSTMAQATAGTFGPFTGGSITLSSGTGQHATIVVSLKGKVSGGGGPQAAVGAIGQRSFASGAWQSELVLTTGDGIRTSDGWMQSVGSASDAIELIYGALKGDGTTPAYFLVRDTVTGEDVQEAVIAAPILSVTCSATMESAAIYVGAPLNQVLTFDGAVGVLEQSATALPLSATAPANPGGNLLAMSGDGLSLTYIDGAVLKIVKRATRSVNWGPQPSIQPQTAAPIGVACSRDFGTLPVGVGSAIEIYQAGGSTYQLQQITTIGGETNVGRGVAANDTGTTVVFTGDTATAVTQSGAVAGQKQTKVHTRIRA